MLLRTLGGMALTGRRFGRHKPLLLLTYLALEGAKSRRFLAALLWPQAERPRHNLEMALYHLRQAVPAAVGSDETRLWASVECDASLLRRAAAEHRWHDVIDIYGGPFLEGIDVAFSTTELEEWVLETRELLASIALRALVEVAEGAQAAGDLCGATNLAERAAVLLPSTRYEDTGLLMRLHALLLSLDSPRATTIRHDVAEFGLSLDDQAYELPVPDSSRTVSHTLPSEATPFVGRVRELGDLESLLWNGVTVLTIHGLSGMGKTRLAVALAHRQVRQGRFDDVHFVALEAVTDPDLVLERVAYVLAGDGVAAQAVSAVRGRLGQKRVLLVLDDVAHDTGASAAVAELAAACPHLTLVATALGPLDVRGEVLYAIDGLRLPETPTEAMERGSEFGSTHLFTRTAQRYDTRFTLAVENAPDVLAICRSVAGAPLGIEMAAALTRVVSLAELAKEVATDLDALVATTDTMPPRHASLREVFGRSWFELDTAGKAGLAGASVFRGGFTRSAAAAVLDMHLPLLTTLLDRSLLRRSGNRYTLHRLVQQYAAEQLTASDAVESVRDRHAEHFCALLEAQRPFAQRAGQRVAYQELDREFPNIRGTWEWAIGSARTDLLERMLPMLARYLLTRRRLTELRRLLDGAAAVVAEQTPLEARVLRARAEAVMTENPAEAKSLFERSLAIMRRHEMIEDEGAALHLCATASLYGGDFTGGRALALAARSQLERHDPEGFLGACFAQLALTTSDSSEWEDLMERAAAGHRRSGNLSELTPLLYSQACHLVTSQGDHATALRHLQEAIELERDQVDRGYLLGHLHTAAGFCQVQLGDLDGAVGQLTESDRIFSQAQVWEGREEWEGPESRGAQRDNWGQAYLHHATGRLEEARDQALRAIDYPIGLELLIHLEIDAGNLREAEQHVEDLTEDTFGPIGVRQVHYMRALKHLFHAEIGQRRRSAAEGTSAADDASAAALVDEVLSALALIHEREFVPLLFEAILVARLIAPSAVAERFLALAAGHPSSRLHTRRRAAALLGIEQPDVEPTASVEAPGPEQVLELVTVLETALVASSRTGLAPPTSRPSALPQPEEHAPIGHFDDSQHDLRHRG